MQAQWGIYFQLLLQDAVSRYVRVKLKIWREMLQPLETAILVWMQHHLPTFPLKKDGLKRHLDGKNYFAEENIQVTAEEESVNRFAVGVVPVLCSPTWFTKSDI
jgi:hypothetical protein